MKWKTLIQYRNNTWFFIDQVMKAIRSHSNMLFNAILLLSAFFWGVSFNMIQETIKTVPVFTFHLFRFGIAGLILFFFLKDKKALVHRQTLLFGVTLGVILFFGYSLQSFGLHHTSSTNSGFLSGLGVIFVPFLAIIVNREKMKLHHWFGTVFALGGMFLFFYNPEMTLNFNSGDYLTLGCAAFWGVQIVLVSRFAKKVNLIALTIVQLWTVALLSGIGSPFEWGIVRFSGISVFTILFTALFCTAFAFLSQTWIQVRVSPIRVALIYSLEPIFAAIVDYLLHLNAWSLIQFCGATAMLLGIIYSQIGQSITEALQLDRIYARRLHKPPLFQKWKRVKQRLIHSVSLVFHNKTRRKEKVGNQIH